MKTLLAALCLALSPAASAASFALTYEAGGEARTFRSHARGAKLFVEEQYQTPKASVQTELVVSALRPTGPGAAVMEFTFIANDVFQSLGTQANLVLTGRALVREGRPLVFAQDAHRRFTVTVAGLDREAEEDEDAPRGNAVLKWTFEPDGDPAGLTLRAAGGPWVVQRQYQTRSAAVQLEFNGTLALRGGRGRLEGRVIINSRDAAAQRPTQRDERVSAALAEGRAAALSGKPGARLLVRAAGLKAASPLEDEEEED